MINPLKAHQNPIDPEVIPPRSESGNKAVSYIPKWVLYGGIGVTALLAVGILRAIFPLLCLAFAAGLILRISRNSR